MKKITITVMNEKGEVVMREDISELSHSQRETLRWKFVGQRFNVKIEEVDHEPA